MDLVEHSANAGSVGAGGIGVFLLLAFCWAVWTYNWLVRQRNRLRFATHRWVVVLEIDDQLVDLDGEWFR